MIKKIVLPSAIQVVDSHTAGEPTRVIIAGGPELGNGALSGRLRRFSEEFDDFRSAVVNEPRGSDVMVGALLCKPQAPDCDTGVIFFNNVGYLGMCGHGTMGVVATLAHLGQIGCGNHRIETPVGEIRTTLGEDGKITVENVASYRFKKAVPIAVPGYGNFIGDIAWGGNWFFIIEETCMPLTFANVDQLRDFTWAVRKSLSANGITGADGDEIDHIELSQPSPTSGLDSRNFILCPGKAYDRSPCGTGTSAKLACLADDGKLAPGQTWRQEGILGTVFEASYERRNGTIIPSVAGSAYVTAEARLIVNPEDPFRAGIRG